MSEICFQQSTFNMYLFIFVCLIVYFVFITQKESFSDISLYKDLTKDKMLLKITELQQEIFDSKIQTQVCERDLSVCKQQDRTRMVTNARGVTRFDDSLNPPDRVYTNARQGYEEYRRLGYLTGDVGQFPVFGRNKYPGRTDKLEYYTINEGRNSIKIPFKTENYNELYDNDTISIPEIGDNLVFKEYEIQSLRYNPSVF